MAILASVFLFAKHIAETKKCGTSATTYYVCRELALEAAR